MSGAEEQGKYVEERYLLEVHTIQCMKVKYLFSVIKDLLFDCNIYFDETGMKICNLDTSKVALVHLKLPTDCFSVYKCTAPRKVGVSITALHKYLGHIAQNNKHTLKLMITEDRPHDLILEIISDNDTDTQRFYMSELDLDTDQGGLEGEKFGCVISMPSDKFQRYCRSHALVGDVMDITTAGEQVILTTEMDEQGQGDRTQSVIRANEQDFDGNDDSEDDDSKQVDAKNRTSIFMINPDDTIAARFSLKFLQMFAKAQNLSPNVVIYFKHEYPLVLLYKMRDLGELKFALAPRVAPTSFA